MFRYEFMRTAFIVGGLLAIVIPMIGNLIVFKRMSMVGDALSHVSLSGIAIGLILNVNPLLGAILMAIVATLSIQYIQDRFGKYTELATAIIMAFGIGLSAVLLGFVESPASFNSFLFGSIVAIGGSDSMYAIILSVIIVIISLYYYRDFFFIAFDETAATLSGINVKRVNTIFMILTAITISVGSRIVGALIVSSLMVIPTATSLQLEKSYRQTMFIAMVYSLVSVWGGLTASYYLNLAPGGTIVLLSIALLMITIVTQQINKVIKK